MDIKGSVLAALERLDWEKLSDSQRSDLLRIYTVLFSRMGKPDDPARQRLITRFDAVFPTKTYEVNADLCQLLVYLEANGVAGKALKLMAKAPSQEEQMEYAKTLRNLKTGWTAKQRKMYFDWFPKAANYKGGQRFQQYIGEIKKAAMATLTAPDLADLVEEFLATAAVLPEAVSKPRPVVKNWKLDELAPVVEKGLVKRNFDQGRLLFGEAKCFSCHRFGNEGGARAPDLTAASGRLSVRDLLDKIIEPSKTISDQYASSVFTLKDGKVVVGRVVNLHDDNMSVMTDMLAPAKLTTVSAKNVETVVPSQVSAMPAGLLDTFREDEILDLLAYILSRGDRKHEMFKK